MISFKSKTKTFPGVDLAGLRPEMTPVLINLERLFHDLGLECVITSACGGKHGRGSLHYVGLALDFRTKTIKETRAKRRLVRDLRRALGRQYDVLLESEGKRNEHLHVEFQPK